MNTLGHAEALGHLSALEVFQSFYALSKQLGVARLTWRLAGLRPRLRNQSRQLNDRIRVDLYSLGLWIDIGKDALPGGNRLSAVTVPLSRLCQAN